MNLSVHQGEIFGLIGHNGAGKSTLFKMLLGLIAPSSGDLLINGKSVQGRHFRQVRRQIGYLPENVVLYDNLNGLETLQFFAKLKGMNGPDSRNHCLERLTEGGWNTQAASRSGILKYASATQFAQALLERPKCFFWMNLPMVWIRRRYVISIRCSTR
jgi:Cu-processing system ATP-binding protein